MRRVPDSCRPACRGFIRAGGHHVSTRSALAIPPAWLHQDDPPLSILDRFRPCPGNGSHAGEQRLQCARSQWSRRSRPAGNPGHPVSGRDEAARPRYCLKSRPCDMTGQTGRHDLLEKNHVSVCGMLTPDSSKDMFKKTVYSTVLRYLIKHSISTCTRTVSPPCHSPARHY